MIINKFGNNVNVTERTIAEQNNVDTEWRQKFNELRSQYPGEDMLTLMDAASNAVAETKTLEQQLAEAIERTAETVENGLRILGSMEAYRAECYEAGRQAFHAGDAGGYKPGRNKFFFEGWQSAADAEYEACRERDDIGREESLYPWRY